MEIKSDTINSEWFTIGKPLFYNNNYGIRFEIGNPTYKLGTKKYFKSAMIRIASIYEDLFSNEEELKLIIYSHRKKCRIDNWNLPEEITECFKNDTHDFKFETTSNIYDPEDDNYITIKSYIRLKRSCLNYMELLRRITRCDMGYDSDVKITDEVFILNKYKNVILHYYDDRGADVVSKDRRDLKILYERRKNWILEYDRERISRQYET